MRRSFSCSTFCSTLCSTLCSVLAALSVAAGCGDNSKECGPGTDDDDGDGFCEAAGGGCGEGTLLDPETGACVIDPSSCQNGTVLINNRCVDPTEGLVIDLSEGPEPNNARVGGVEPSGAYAGEIVLPGPAGGDAAFVVRGTIDPFRDADNDGEVDPDMDAYTLTVDAPTLLEVSVDGVGGLMAAFLVVPLADNPAAGWQRFGLNVTGDTSRRLVYLPAPGRYAISVADTRSMWFDGDSPPAAGAGAAAGNPEARYYMSIAVRPIPAPMELTVSGGTATHTGMLAPGELAFFTAPMGLGFNDVELDIPTTPAASVVVARNGAYKADAAETIDFFQGPLPAIVTTGGFLPEDNALIVADTVYHYGPGPATYRLTVRQGDAAALPRTGDTAAHPEVANQFTAFYYDVGMPGEVTGFALTWNQPVSGVIVDDDLYLVANFTYDPQLGFTDRTFTSYTGLVRHREAGRYYFLVFDPEDTGPAEIAATSTIAPQAAPEVVPGTPLEDQPVSTQFRSNAFTYHAGDTAPWQRFEITGTGTGAITAAYHDRATAYGRLDPLTAAGTDPLVDDVEPVFTHTFAEDGGAQGRILLDDPATSYLVTTHTQTVTGAPALTLDFRPRMHHDFGTIGAGQTAMAGEQTLDPASPVRYYLLRATPGDRLTVTADPITATLDLEIEVLTADEAVDRAFDTAPAGADEVAELLQRNAGWTALAVSSATPLTGDAAFNLTIGAADFVPPTYMRTAGTTAYTDACLGGTLRPLVHDGGTTGTATDEGLTARIAAPPGFAFFGVLEPHFVVSSNGWLSFGPVTRAAYVNASMPSAAPPDAVIAPYWDDLANVTICTKAVGDRLVVQWTGNLYTSSSTVVELQAILDGATDRIELVWGPGHVPTGAGATVGIEDQVGGTAHQVGFDTPGGAPAGTSIVLAPM